MKQVVLNIEGKSTNREVDLNPHVFDIEPNQHVVYLDVKRIRAANRQGTHKTKERGEVEGSTRKIQKQKGSGNARKGDKKANLMRGGGRAHGPRPRDYDIKVNKKTKQLAKRSALSTRARNKQLTILESFSFETPKTKQYLKVLNALSCQDKKTLLVLDKPDQALILSARNIPHTKVMLATDLNTYAILEAQHLLINEQAVATLNDQLK